MYSIHFRPRNHCTAAQVKEKLYIQVIREVGGGQNDSILGCNSVTYCIIT